MYTSTANKTQLTWTQFEKLLNIFQKTGQLCVDAYCCMIIRKKNKKCWKRYWQIVRMVSQPRRSDYSFTFRKLLYDNPASSKNRWNQFVTDLIPIINDGISENFSCSLGNRDFMFFIHCDEIRPMSNTILCWIVFMNIELSQSSNCIWTYKRLGIVWNICHDHVCST